MVKPIKTSTVETRPKISETQNMSETTEMQVLRKIVDKNLLR